MKYAASLLLVLVHTASADTAGGELEHGRSALRAGRIHEACEAFEASEKLAAAVDTELALASCYEQDGKPVSAARLYRMLAETDPNSERRKTSAAKAPKLAARAAKLRFAVNPNPPGLVIKVDGVVVPATEDAPVDTGPHDVVATAPGFEGHASVPVDRERAILDVIIRMEPREEAPAAAPAPAPMPAPAAAAAKAEPSEPMMAPPMTDAMLAADHRKRNGVILGAAGLGLLGGAVALFAVSANKYSDEHALCPKSMCANQDDLDKASSLLSQGDALRGTSIGMGIGGGALLIVGGYLLLTHKADSHVAINVDQRGGSVAFTARF